MAEVQSEITQRQIDVVVALHQIVRSSNPVTAADIALQGNLGDARGVAQTLRKTGRDGLTESNEDKGYFLTRKGSALARKAQAPASGSDDES